MTNEYIVVVVFHILEPVPVPSFVFSERKVRIYTGLAHSWVSNDRISFLGETFL